MEEFGPFDILFYVLAIYAGYKYAFRNVSDEEMMEVARQPAGSAEVKEAEENEDVKTPA